MQRRFKTINRAKGDRREAGGEREGDEETRQVDRLEPKKHARKAKAERKVERRKKVCLARGLEIIVELGSAGAIGLQHGVLGRATQLRGAAHHGACGDEKSVCALCVCVVCVCVCVCERRGKSESGELSRKRQGRSKR
jgi:hypothetical protein